MAPGAKADNYNECECTGTTAIDTDETARNKSIIKFDNEIKIQTSAESKKDKRGPQMLPKALEQQKKQMDKQQSRTKKINDTIFKSHEEIKIRDGFNIPLKIKQIQFSGQYMIKNSMGYYKT